MRFRPSKPCISYIGRINNSTTSRCGFVNIFDDICIKC